MTRQRFLVLLFVAIFSLISLSAVSAQDTASITIFVDRNYLIVYVPGNQFVNLEGLTFEVVIDQQFYSHSLQDYSAFGVVRFNTIPAPMCFRLQRTSASDPLPQECQNEEVTTLTEFVAPANAFWYSDDSANVPVILVLWDTNLLGYCQTSCRFDLPQTPSGNSNPPPPVTENPRPSVTENPPPTPICCVVTPNPQNQYQIVGQEDYTYAVLAENVEPNSLLCLTTGPIVVDGTNEPVEFQGNGRSTAICWIGPQLAQAHNLTGASLKRVSILRGNAEEIAITLVQEWGIETTTRPDACGISYGPCVAADLAVIRSDGSVIRPTLSGLIVPPTPNSTCASITRDQLNLLNSVQDVASAIRQTEEFSGHSQNNYQAGDIVPEGVLIATDLQSTNLSQFGVIPINNQGGWGLFLTTNSISAPNDGTYWCINEALGLVTPTITPFCAFITQSQMEALRTIGDVATAIRQAEEFSGHRQNNYIEGSTIPAGVLIATDLQTTGIEQFGVTPINNQGGWGLFLTTRPTQAPNDGTYWCIQE